MGQELQPGLDKSSRQGSGLDPKPDQKSNREFEEQMQGAVEAESREVERLYSTKAIRFRLGGRRYSVPVNYFTPKGRDEPESGDSEGFGFTLFLPNFVGYTKDNWKDPFDRRLVKVIEVKPVDKLAIVTLTDGTSRRVSPSSYGESKARFENRKPRLESQPSFSLYGLTGYRYKGGGATPGIVWTGTRSNGEFFFFESPLAPDQPVRPDVYPTHPHCKTEYYSEQEDLFILYIYSQDHIAKWKEIDDAIWAKIHSWRMT
jgi:hypothetical protein